MSGGPVHPIPRQILRSSVQQGRSWRLSLLGGWALRDENGDVAMSASGQRLLAVLAIRGRSQRDFVAGQLWPDNDDQSALANLRTTLWRVRRRAPGVLAGSAHEIGLSPQVVVDVHGLVSAGRHLIRGEYVAPVDWAEVGHSLARYAPLLPGWYEDWVLAERERLQQLQVHALEIAAERLVQAEQLGAALEIAQAATMVEPFRETAHCAVVKVLLQQSNTAQAVRHYQRYEQLLNRELGIEPSSDLRDLMRPVLGDRVRT